MITTEFLDKIKESKIITSNEYLFVLDRAYISKTVGITSVALTIMKEYKVICNIHYDYGALKAVYFWEPNVVYRDNIFNFDKKEYTLEELQDPDTMFNLNLCENYEYFKLVLHIYHNLNSVHDL